MQANKLRQLQRTPCNRIAYFIIYYHYTNKTEFVQVIVILFREIVYKLS